MTPTKKGKTTTIRIEKVRKAQLDESQVAHVGGGQHSGLVINKQSGKEENGVFLLTQRIGLITLFCHFSDFCFFKRQAYQSEMR